MKVKCIKSKHPNKESIYTNLAIGKEYTVLSIEFYDKSESSFSKALGDFVAYRIIGNDNMVSCCPAELFEIVSGNLPSTWVSYREENGDYSMLPKSWARMHFWSDYYDDNPNAINDFDFERKKIFTEELKDEDIDNILQYGDLKEVDFLLDSLIVTNDCRAKRIAMKVANSDKWIPLWEEAYKYLANFEEQDVEDLFVDFLIYNEKTKPTIAAIVNFYLSKKSN